MGKSKNIGEFEILVLAAIVRLGADAYGLTIRKEIESRTNRTVSVGALYTTLSRLEAKAFVTSRIGEATAQRGGRAKKYYEISAEGRVQFERSLSSIGAMVKDITPWPDPAFGAARS